MLMAHVLGMPEVPNTSTESMQGRVKSSCIHRLTVSGAKLRPFARQQAGVTHVLAQQLADKSAPLAAPAGLPILPMLHEDVANHQVLYSLLECAIVEAGECLRVFKARSLASRTDACVVDVVNNAYWCVQFAHQDATAKASRRRALKVDA